MSAHWNRIWFDRTSAHITLAGVVVGMVLMLVCAALAYHFVYLVPHILDLNPHNRGMAVGFVQAPDDMDNQRGLVSWTAEFERAHVWREDIRLPPVNVDDQVRVRLVYWSGNGTVQKVWEQSFYFARDPAGVYISIHKVREVFLYDRNDNGELYPLISAPVTIPVPREYFAPPLPSPSPSPSPRKEPPSGGPRVS